MTTQDQVVKAWCLWAVLLGLAYVADVYYPQITRRNAVAWSVNVFITMSVLDFLRLWPAAILGTQIAPLLVYRLSRLLDWLPLRIMGLRSVERPYELVTEFENVYESRVWPGDVDTRENTRKTDQ